MFRPVLDPSEGILLVESSESKISTSIHMFFMNFDIAVFWIDSQNKVVDSVLAKKWAPYYAPSMPAQYTLEAHPNQLSLIHVGDILEFEDL